MFRQVIVVALLGGAVTVEAQPGAGARRPGTDSTPGTPAARPAPVKAPRPQRAPRAPGESREWFFPIEPPSTPDPVLHVEPMIHIAPMPHEPLLPPLPHEPMLAPMPHEPLLALTPPTPAAPLQGGPWRVPGFDAWRTPDFDFHFDPPHFDYNFDFDFNLRGHDFPKSMPAPWVQGDVADSLWRRGRELVNRGEYRQAANTLRTIPQRYPNSALVGDALYWQAHSLYRIGGTTELREALTALETLMSKYPNARSQPDAQPLAARINGALAARGDAEARRNLSTMASQGQASCDREEQAVRAEALSALIKTNPDDMSSLMRQVLARKDECSVQLRKTAVYLVGNKRDAQASTVLIGVAKTDPSVDVRVDAINWLGRLPGDDVVNALVDLTRTEEDERVQRAAIRALVNHPSDRARQQIRSLVERTDAPEKMRYEALSAFSPERVTSDDVAWLRTVYTKLDNQRLKQRALSTIVRVSGSETDQWLMTIVRNEDEPGESRAIALRRIGQTLPIADISKMYDAASSRSLREQLITILGQRKEPEATDKLIDIAKNGTDPNLRTRSINVLSEKNDPRTRALLLELINK